MDTKLRTTVYLDRDVKRLVEDESLNLSKWINDNLMIALCSVNENDLVKEISELDGKKRIVEKRLDDLKTRKKEDGEELTIRKEATNELWKAYSVRSSKGLSHDQNLAWITAPTNLMRCKLLGKNADEVLKMLEDWDNDEKAD